MAANIRVLTEEEWAVVEPILSDLDEGGVLVTPEGAKRFKDKFGLAIPEDLGLIEYDFGGECDIMVDVFNSTSAYVTPYIKAAIDGSDPDADDGEDDE